MESIIPLVSSFLPRRESQNIPLVSSDWYQSIRENERLILEGLYRLYPASTTYGSIILAIKAEDTSRISSITNDYLSYLPLKWYHIMQRMLWRDIPVSSNMKVISYMIFERTMEEINSQDIDMDMITHLRFFAFKFEVGDMIDRVSEIDIMYFPYELYQHTEEYTRFSQNIPDIVSNRIEIFDVFPEELIQLISWALRWDRVDILQYIYNKDNDIGYEALHSALYDESPPCMYRAEILSWLMSIPIGQSLCQGIIEDRETDMEITSAIYRTDALNLVRSHPEISPESFNPIDVNPQALALYFKHSDNIDNIPSSLTPEVYLMILENLNSNDPLFWKVIADTINADVSEILEKYITSDPDAERALLQIDMTIPDNTSGQFFTYQWYSYRRDLLSSIVQNMFLLHREMDINPVTEYL